MSYAQHELDILCQTAGPNSDDRPLIEEFIPEMLALLDKFGESGQSGGSAPYTANAICSTLKKLMLQKPICPITGVDDEWNDVSSMSHDKLPSYQNNRCSAVFKNGTDGRAYYLDAIVWKGDTEGESGNDWDTFTGTCWGITSRQFIKSFPFTPKTFYIDVHRVPYDPSVHPVSESVSCGPGDFVYLIKDEKQLDEVWEYYNKFTYEKAQL